MKRYFFAAAGLYITLEMYHMMNVKEIFQDEIFNPNKGQLF